jgi:hypothetical protein
MAKQRSSIGYFLESSNLMLTNAKEDEQISALLVPYRVNEQRYQVGLSLCKKGYDLEIQQIKFHGQQYRAYKKFEKTYNVANEVYQVHLKFLRISFDKDKEKLKELSAKGIRPINTADWLKQAFAFYQTTVIDEEAMSELDFYGITAELLQANEKKIYEVEAAYREHKSKMGAAQDAVDQRDQALKYLAKFMKRFVAVCRTALKEHPQLMEKLGIRVYSPNYVKPKAKTNGEQPPAGDGETLPPPPAGTTQGAIIESPTATQATTSVKKRKKEDQE